MFRCTTPQYDTLYARWLTSPGDLLDIVGYQPGMRLLDLCGGTGAVTIEALRRGAPEHTLTLFDLNPRLSPNTDVRSVRGDAKNLSQLLPEFETFDVIVCRQALAYLDIQGRLPQDLHHLLKPGGVLVFNTFVRPRWSWKSYSYHGHDYFEASGWIPTLKGGHVGHLQWCKDVGWDVTRFYWHRRVEVHKAFSSFHVEVQTSQRGIRWICKKI